MTRGVEFGVTRRYRAIDEEMSAVAPQISADTIRLDVSRLRQAVEGEIGVGIVEAETGANMLVGVQLESDRAAARLGDVIGAVEASSPCARLEQDGIGFIARALLETRRTEPIDERGEQSAAVRLGYVGKDDSDFAAELD